MVLSMYGKSGDSKKRHQSEEVPQKEHESTSLNRIIIQKENILNKEELIYINGKHTHTFFHIDCAF